MKTLKVGDKAPSFEGKDQDGKTIRLSDFDGKKLILYFYPKDNTPGCTAEACSLRDGRDDLAEMGFSVLGVSPDSEKSHRGFIAKHGLNFPLIADTDKTIATAYGIWGEKSSWEKPIRASCELHLSLTNMVSLKKYTIKSTQKTILTKSWNHTNKTHYNG